MDITYITFRIHDKDRVYTSSMRLSLNLLETYSYAVYGTSYADKDTKTQVNRNVRRFASEHYEDFQRTKAVENELLAQIMFILQECRG